MTSGPHPSELLDAVKASASKLKERQAVLEARAKELEALQGRLDTERTEIEDRAAKLTTDREALEHERHRLEDIRASVEKDLASIDDGRTQLAKEAERLESGSKALQERETRVKTDEDRVERLSRSLKEEMIESESRLRELLERGQDLTKLQASWLATLETRQKELQTIGAEMNAHRDDLLRQHDSLATLREGLKDEVSRLLAEREALTAKESSILQAQEVLATALHVAEFDFGDEQATVTPHSAAPSPEPIAPPPEPTPSPTPPEVAPEPAPVAPSPATVANREERLPEKVTGPWATKAEAMERLKLAVESWKRARDAGYKVGDMRRTIKVARDALDAGEYDGALQLANEILEQLQVSAVAK